MFEALSPICLTGQSPCHPESLNYFCDQKWMCMCVHPAAITILLPPLPLSPQQQQNRDWNRWSIIYLCEPESVRMSKMNFILEASFALSLSPSIHSSRLFTFFTMENEYTQIYGLWPLTNTHMHTIRLHRINEHLCNVWVWTRVWVWFLANFIHKISAFIDFVV